MNSPLRITASWIFALVVVNAAAVSTPPTVAQQSVSPRVTSASISEKVTINTTQATAWTDGQSRVLMLRGGVSIVTENLTLSAHQAVVWLTPIQPVPPNQAQLFRVDVALLGDATAQQLDTIRQGPELIVTLQTRPDIQLVAGQLIEQSGRNDATYLQGLELRQGGLGNANPTEAGRGEVDGLPGAPTATLVGTPPFDRTQPSPRELRPPAPVTPLTPEVARQVAGPVNFRAGRASTETGPDGKVIVVLTDDVFLLQRRPNGDLIELRADRGVVFTSITDLNNIIRDNQGRTELEESVSAVYLEGDVRVNFTPAIARDGKQRGEQRLRANRATYDFDNDRAILTDAVLQTEDPSRGVPLVLRAREIRRIAQDRYAADNAQISTSTFGTPGLSLGARRVQVSQSDSGGPRDGIRTSFVANDVTPQALGVPFFYLPRIWGSTTDRGSPLREVQLGGQRSFGIGVESRWGLFETLGRQPPRGVDASYRLDYYSQRGPAIGLDASYSGALVDPATGLPRSYFGDLTSYYAYDFGTDRFSRDRATIERDGDTRGQVRWRHQQYLEDNWQAQLQVAHATDVGFRPEWFESQFNNGLPYESSLYLKRTSENESFSVYANVDLIGFPTVADQLQEGIARFDSNGRDYFNYTVQQLPTLSYDVAGQPFLNDSITFSSSNAIGGILVKESRSGLVQDLGFRDSSRTSRDDSFPGLPSSGFTGVTDEYYGKADLRQEIGWPLSVGEVKVVPFIFGRYLGYTNSPDGDSKHRLVAGGGVRASSTFWRVDDSVRSKLFDLNRSRHIVTPEITGFAGLQTDEREEAFFYDEMSDAATDISAVNVVLRQIWQTKRGQSGRERSVDFLTFNVGFTWFGNAPDEFISTNSRGEQITGQSFRGMWFETMPEVSIPRSTVYADTAWRVTDTTVMLGDASYNTDAESLATAALGVAIEREPRVRYFAGLRYIGDLNSTILTFSIDYEISRKYSANVNQAFDLTDGGSRDTSATIFRRFEQFVGYLNFYYDQIESAGGLRLGLSPGGIRAGTTNLDLRRH